MVEETGRMQVPPTVAKFMETLRKLPAALGQIEGRLRECADHISGSLPEKPDPDKCPENPVSNLREDLEANMTVVVRRLAGLTMQAERIEAGLGLGRATQDEKRFAPGQLVEFGPHGAPFIPGTLCAEAPVIPEDMRRAQGLYCHACKIPARDEHFDSMGNCREEEVRRHGQLKRLREPG